MPGETDADVGLVSQGETDADVGLAPPKPANPKFAAFIQKRFKPQFLDTETSNPKPGIDIPNARGELVHLNPSEAGGYEPNAPFLERIGKGLVHTESGRGLSRVIGPFTEAMTFGAAPNITENLPPAQTTSEATASIPENLLGLGTAIATPSGQIAGMAGKAVGAVTKGIGEIPAAVSTFTAAMNALRSGKSIKEKAKEAALAPYEMAKSAVTLPQTAYGLATQPQKISPQQIEQLGGQVTNAAMLGVPFLARLPKRLLLTRDGIRQFMRSNPEKAAELAGKTEPTRKDFTGVVEGHEKLDKTERQAVATMIRQEAANAGAVRADQGVVSETGQVQAGGGEAGGHDVQRASQAGNGPGDAQLRQDGGQAQGEAQQATQGVASSAAAEPAAIARTNRTSEELTKQIDDLIDKGAKVDDPRVEQLVAERTILDRKQYADWREEAIKATGLPPEIANKGFEAARAYAPGTSVEHYLAHDALKSGTTHDIDRTLERIYQAVARPETRPETVEFYIGGTAENPGMGVRANYGTIDPEGIRRTQAVFNAIVDKIDPSRKVNLAGLIPKSATAKPSAQARPAAALPADVARAAPNNTETGKIDVGLVQKALDNEIQRFDKLHLEDEGVPRGSDAPITGSLHFILENLRVADQLEKHDLAGPAETLRRGAQHEYQKPEVQKALADATQSTTPLPAEQARAAPTKQPWEMTKAEYAKKIINDFQGTETQTELKKMGFSGDIEPNMTTHFNQVYNAMKRGEPIPPEVLADYPDLKPSPAPGAADAPTKNAPGAPETKQSKFSRNLELRRVRDQLRTFAKENEAMIVGDDPALRESEPNKQTSYTLPDTKEGRSYAKEIKANLPDGLKRSVRVVPVEAYRRLAPNDLDKVMALGEQGAAQAIIETSKKGGAEARLIQSAADFILQHPDQFGAELAYTAERYKLLSRGDKSELKPLQGKTPEVVTAGQLKVGDEMTRHGEKYRVLERDEGVVRIKDGVEYTLDPSDQFAIDKGTLKEGKKPPPETTGPRFENLLGERQAAAPLTGRQNKLLMGGEDVTLRPQDVGPNPEPKPVRDAVEAQIHRQYNPESTPEFEALRERYGSPGEKPSEPESTADRLEREAIHEIQSQSSTMPMGLNPASLAPYVKFGAAQVLKGVDTLDQFRQKLQETFGQPIANAAEDIWDRVHNGAPPLEANRSETSVAAGLAGAVDTYRKLVNPMKRGEQGALTARIIRANAGELAHQQVRFENAMRDTRRVLNRLSTDEQRAFIDRMEAGEKQPTAPLQTIADSFRKILDDGRDAIRALGTGKLEEFYDTYFPHIFKQPGLVQQALRAIRSRTPYRGKAGFIKRRTLGTFAEARAAGQEMISDNPADVMLLHNFQVEKYLAANRTLNELKELGIPKFVRGLQRPPEGYARIEDPTFSVFLPKEIEIGGEKVKLPGTIQGGYWAVPDEVAGVLNNYLKPGLGGNPLFDIVRRTGNAMNMAQLGLSAFHAMFTTIDTVVNRLGLGFGQITRGNPKGIFNMLTSPLAPVIGLYRGRQLMKWYKADPSTLQPWQRAMVEAMTKGGGRIAMDKFYHNSAAESFWNAVHDAAYGKGLERAKGAGSALWRAPWAAVETTAKPLMEWLVPTQKAGVAFELLKDDMHNLGPDATLDQQRKLFQESWDAVDNRMGQLVYDNLFWNKTFKDLAMVLTRSLGWNLGSLRLGLGAIADVVKTPFRVARGEHVMTRNMEYAAALPIVVGTLGAMYQYLKTGKGPDELLDYFYPKNGGTNSDGTPARSAFATYMKDVFAYAHAPVQTLGHKVHPLVSSVIEMLQNKDFYGNQLRNPDDPIVQQGLDLAKYAAEQFVPFSVRNLQQAEKVGQGSPGEAFFGITPAPHYIGRSEAQKAVAEWQEKNYGNFAPKTPEMAEKQRAKSDFIQSIKNLDPSERNAMIEANPDLTKRQKSDIKRTIGLTKLENVVGRGMKWDDALKIWDKATEDERTDKLRDIMKKKLRNAYKNAAKVDKQRIKDAAEESGFDLTF